MWDTPPGKPNFAASAQNYAYFNSVAATKFGDKPAKIAASINEAGNSAGGTGDHESESAIFYLDPTSGEITSQWVNTDGCMCPQFPIYRLTANFCYLAFVYALFVINTQRRINISGNLTRYFQEWQGAPARIFCSNPTRT